MKRTTILLAATLCFALPAVEAQQTSSAKKTLVVYFSHSGNTRTVAEQIQKATGADVFEIETAKPYPKEYQALTEQAQKEIRANYRPALKNLPAEIESYDLIFIGSPCWWGTVAPPVATFLGSFDFTGRTLAPFMTHGGSGMGRSVADIRELCPNSVVCEGLPVRGASAANAGSEIGRWLHKLEIH